METLKEYAEKFWRFVVSKDSSIDRLNIEPFEHQQRPS